MAARETGMLTKQSKTTNTILNQVDHLVYATPDLNMGVHEIERLLGVRPAPGGRHPGWGTQNALLSLGGQQYLEVLGPDPDQHGFDGHRLFAVDELSQSCLLTWAAKSKNLESLVDTALQNGLNLGEVNAGSRKLPDGTNLSWRMTDPFKIDYDGLRPFFIDWGTTPHPADSAPSGCVLTGLYGEHPEADRVRAGLTALGIELEIKQSSRPGLVATIRTPKGITELR